MNTKRTPKIDSPLASVVSIEAGGNDPQRVEEIHSVMQVELTQAWENGRSAVLLVSTAEGTTSLMCLHALPSRIASMLCASAEVVMAVIEENMGNDRTIN